MTLLPFGSYDAIIIIILVMALSLSGSYDIITLS